jgi:DNA-binding protein Fis
MATTQKKYKKKPLKRSVKSATVVTSSVITVRISDEEKMRIEKIMAELDIKNYSDVMRMALHMVKPTLQYG